MNYKKISIEDKKSMEMYFAKSGIIHCNASFCANFCYSERYNYEWCVCDGFFIMRFLSDDKKTMHFQPIGDGDVTSIISVLEAEAKEQGLPLIICDATLEFVEQMRHNYPEWGFYSDRSYSDYIYNSNDLKSLKGKKYQQKRNLVNHFEAHNNYRYEPLTPSLFDECVQLAKLWIDEKRLKGEDIDAQQLEDDMRDELTYIEKAFAYFQELELFGGALFADDHLVAFSFGSALSENVFCTHIEKANSDYVGAFSMMNQQLALHLPKQFKFIDREWDAGIRGLRTAKLQYHPAFLSEERIGRRLTPTELQVRNLWLACFPEDKVEDVDEFIFKRLHTSTLFSHEEDGQIVSTFFAVSFGDIVYLYAGMTLPQYRGRGFFREVFYNAVDVCKEAHIKRIAIIPANESIGQWYRKQGFDGNYHFLFNTKDEYDFGTGDSTKDYGMIMQLDGMPLPAEEEIVLTDERI